MSAAGSAPPQRLAEIQVVLVRESASSRTRAAAKQGAAEYATTGQGARRGARAGADGATAERAIGGRGATSGKPERQRASEYRQYRRTLDVHRFILPLPVASAARAVAPDFAAGSPL